MKQYKYKWEVFSIDELEEKLNIAGKVGWRVVYLEWDSEGHKYYALLEQEKS